MDNPAACGSNHTSGLSSSAGTPDDEYGKVAYRSHFFASAGETKEIVSALMGLSQLCDDAATPSATSMSSTPKAGSGGGGGAAGSLSGGGGSSGGGGGGSGSGGGNSGGSGTSGGGNASGGAGGGAGATGGGSGTPGNRGVKLICSLAILAIGLSDATSLLTTRQRVRVNSAGFVCASVCWWRGEARTNSTTTYYSSVYCMQLPLIYVGTRLRPVSSSTGGV